MFMGADLLAKTSNTFFFTIFFYFSWETNYKPVDGGEHFTSWTVSVVSNSENFMSLYFRN